MEPIDLMELIPHVDTADFDEGTYCHEITLPDGRSVELEYTMEIHGYSAPSWDSADGMSEGCVEIRIHECIGYAEDGGRLPVRNFPAFELKLQELLNNN